MIIEDRLRATFAGQVESARIVDDPAGRAIRRGRATRRRRTLGSSVAATACTLLLLSGAVWAQGRPPADGDESVAGPFLPPSEAPPAPAVTPAPPAATASPVGPGPSTATAVGGARAIGLDLRVDRQVWTVAGRRFTLSGVGAVSRVYRVPLGWIYGGAERVRLLRADGTSVLLGSLGGAWLVSPEGDRLAYVRGRQLAVHRIGRRGLIGGATAPVPSGARPVTFAGERLVVAAAGRTSYAALTADPAAVAVSPAWTPGVLAAYGRTGNDVAGLVSDGDRACLATLEPARTLAVVRRGSCRPRSLADPRAILAPNGRWLAERSGNAIVLVRVDRAVEDIESAVPCPAAGGGAPAWVDAGTLAGAAGHRVVLCGTDGGVRTVRLPDEVAGDWALVPRYAPPTPR